MYRATASILLFKSELTRVRLVRTIYNAALLEKMELERNLDLIELGTPGRTYLICEIAKLQDIVIKADQRITNAIDNFKLADQKKEYSPVHFGPMELKWIEVFN